MGAFADFRLNSEINSIILPNDTKLTQINNKNLLLQIKPTNIYKREYSFNIQIPDDYPFESPKILCLNKIYHPNIDANGNVCLDFIRHKWTSAMGISWIVYGIYLFFLEPSGENALNTEAGDLLLKNKKEFIKKAINYEKENY